MDRHRLMPPRTESHDTFHPQPLLSSKCDHSTTPRVCPAVSQTTSQNLSHQKPSKLSSLCSSPFPLSHN